MYSALAGLVAVLHGALVVCVVAGAVTALGGQLHRKPHLAVPFYFLLGLVIASDLVLGECALTRLEQRLHDLASPGSAYHGSFIGHYFGFLPPFVHQGLGPAIVVAALLAYPFWRWRDRRVTRVEIPEAR